MTATIAIEPTADGWIAASVTLNGVTTKCGPSATRRTPGASRTFALVLEEGCEAARKKLDAIRRMPR